MIKSLIDLKSILFENRLLIDLFEATKVDWGRVHDVPFDLVDESGAEVANFLFAHDFF